jgi:hypothetical protein
MSEGGDGMDEFSPEYRQAIETSLRGFVDNGDDVACIGYFAFRYGNCQMCPKEGIRWHYVLESLRTHRWLIVGSECVQNYQVILSEWGYKPAHIVFPGFLRPYSRWILEKNPDAVVFDDGIVMRFQADCAMVIKSNSEPQYLEHYRYAARSVVDGVERVVGVDEAGRRFPVGTPVDRDADYDYGDFDPDEETGWEYCDCGEELSYCPDCDNEMCPMRGEGCTCDECDYEDDDPDDEERW